MKLDRSRDGGNSRPDTAVFVERPAYHTGDSGVMVESERYDTSNSNEKDGSSRLVGFLTSLMGNSSKPKAPVELNDLGGRNRRDTVSVVISPDESPGAAGGFDVCREYNCTTDDDDDDVDDDDDQANSPFSTKGPKGPPLYAFVLGKSYCLLQDHNARRDDEASLFWFTYRCDFPEIVPYNLRSDAGWGCMLRSAQMLLGQALRLHYKSRDWRPPQHCSSRRTDPFMRSVLTWFADFPSTDQCYYSLHNMVAAGLRYDKLPGEWYGPGTACYVIRDLVQMHERRQQHIQQQQRIFRVHVASQGTVYRDSIQDLMARESREKIVKETEKKHKVKPQPHPLDFEWEEELVEAIGNVEWDTGLLLLVPVRLGLTTFNGDYVRAVAQTFSFPQSVGVLGGRVRGARWFYGAVSDGSKVFGLDPHTVQSAPHSRTALINGKTTSTVDLRDDYIMSCHTNYSEVLSLEKMDPSIAFGFYCRNQGELENLFQLFRDWRVRNPGQPELFSVADAAPNYAANVSASVGSMMLDGSSLLDDNDVDVQSNSSNDNDFVML
ncbi:hypothetical protein ACA910_003109 [Epithemia clementina (nom. ined.)]